MQREGYPGVSGKSECSGDDLSGKMPGIITEFAEDNLIPVVVADISGQPQEHNCISIDYYGSTLMLLNSLKENGYRDYIFVRNIVGSPSSFEEIEFNCFKTFLETNSFKGEILYYQETLDDYLAVISKKVEQANTSTVFIAESRQFTVELLKLFAYHHKSYPADVGLVGNNLLAEYVVPKFWSIKYDFNAIGKTL